MFKQANSFISFLILFVLCAPSSDGALPLKTTLPAVTLSGEHGGTLDGKPWSSDALTGKIFVIFYVDPDHADTNSHVSKALKARQFPFSQFASVAIVNMAASWAPNFAIDDGLEEKQKTFPRTVYVRDRTKRLVDKWSMSDDSSNVILVDENRQVLFSVDGKLSNGQIGNLLQLIAEQLQKTR